MSFFKKVKDFIFGEDLVDHFEHQPSRSRRDAEPSGRNPADLRERLAAAQAALAAREAARVPPLLQDAHPEVGGGVQGLQWYKSRMQQDADGDIADQFLSEPRASAAAGATSAGSSNPEALQGAKRPRTGRERQLPPLQTQRAYLQKTGAADMVVEQGNVHVVPVT